MNENEQSTGQPGPMQPRPMQPRMGEHGPSLGQTLFEAVGGIDFFNDLVHRFYDRVWEDEVMRPMYPQDDREGAEWRLANFLAQYFGGPSEYSQQRGHPRLRMRHAPFRIDQDARERWLRHMNAALDELEVAPLHRAEMTDYFERAATAMINFNPAFQGPQS
ncbi:globin [uncultured Agrococcus sp.]|uniref:globin n=1 Tax=uncultured Agrococcus sp. TaxID=382258 RepID=UPI0025F26B2A|nr:globin [uncultured Agrococcus sp.]